MAASRLLSFNGKHYKADKLLISPDNRSFRYGDGFFETMKLHNGKILLEEDHFERLFRSLQLLQFAPPGYFTPAYLKQQVLDLATANQHNKLSRIRLTVFRGNGGLYDPENHFPNVVIQSWELNPTNNRLNENGLVTDIYPDARKACDLFSPVKSNNYLAYAMAALWAKQQHLNDAIVLNCHNRIADATIANVFMVKDGVVHTPALEEGCVAGVMRRYLLRCLRKENIPVQETAIETVALLQASELFLTNGIYGIRWVQSCGKANYSTQLAAYLYKKYLHPLLAS